MKSIINIIIALVTLMLLNINSNAQWTNNPQSGMSIVTNETGQDGHPQIVHITNDRYLIGWLREQYNRAKFQLIDREGNTLLEPNGRYLIEGNWINIGKFISDGQGGAICIFSDWRSGHSQIYGQRIDSNGNRLWGENGLPLVTWNDGNVGLKDVVQDIWGNGFISWSKNVSPINEIYVQKFNLISGTRHWGDMGVMDCSAQAICDYQQTIADEQGGVIDLWSDQRFGGGFGKLFAQHLDSNGNLLWTPNGIPVRDPNTGDQLLESVQIAVPDGQGGGIWVNELPTYHTFNLFRLTGTGTVSWIWSHGGVETFFVTDMTRHPRDGMLWVTSYEPDGYHLYKFDPLTGQQFFGPDGLLYGGEKIVPVSDGVIIPTHDVVRSNMKVRRVNNNGVQLWNNFAVTQAWDYEFASLAATSDSADGAVVAFNDFHLSQQIDISAQRVLSSGRLGTPNPPSTKGTRPPADLHLSVRPNPFNPTTTFTFTLPEAAKVTLDVFDVGGRMVSGKDGGLPHQFEAGTYEITFDGSDLPSGVYIYKLTTSGSRATPTMLSGKMVLLK
jgi:hypothetical protein